MTPEERQAIELQIDDLEDERADINAQIEAANKMMEHGNAIDPLWYRSAYRALSARKQSLKKLKQAISPVDDEAAIKQKMEAAQELALRRQIQLENMRNATVRKEMHFLAKMKPGDLASRFMLAARQTLSADQYYAILRSVDQEAA